MNIYAGSEDRYRGLEKHEGKWVELFRVEVDHAYPGFKTKKTLDSNYLLHLILESTSLILLTIFIT